MKVSIDEVSISIVKHSLTLIHDNFNFFSLGSSSAFNLRKIYGLISIVLHFIRYLSLKTLSWYFAAMRFVLLDFARGCASAFVLGFHLLGSSDSFFELSWLSVDLFFVLSGFVLSKSILELSARGNSGKTMFVKKRILRLLPMLTLSLCFVFIVKVFEFCKELVSRNTGDSPAFTIYTPLFFLLSFMLIQFTFPISSNLLIPLWSLSAEFYSSILILFFCFTNSIRRICAGLLLGGALIYFSGFTIDHNLDWTKRESWVFGFGRAIIGFCLGQLVWHFFSKEFRFMNAISIGLVILAGICVLLIWHRAETYILFPSLFFFSCAVLALARLNSRISSIIVIKFFRFLGTTSYGVYLLHPSVIILLDPILGFSGILRFIVVYICVVISSYVLTRFLEPKLRNILSSWLKVPKHGH